MRERIETPGAAKGSHGCRQYTRCALREIRRTNIDVVEGSGVFILEAAKIAAVDQNIARGNNDAPVQSKGVGDETKGCHFFPTDAEEGV